MTAASTYGDAVFTTHWNDDRTESWLTCERADPRIRISDVLLHGIASGEMPAASLTLPTGTAIPPAHPSDWFGAVLTINCVNRRLVYRITGWEPLWLEAPGTGTYLAEWPG